MLRVLLACLCWGLFLEDAHALLGSGTGGGGALAQFIPLILIFGIFWFLIIRPQQKRLREHRRLVDELKIGDRIWTDGGIQGVIKQISADEMTLEIAPKVLVKMKRGRASERLGASKTASKQEVTKSTAKTTKKKVSKRK